MGGFFLLLLSFLELEREANPFGFTRGNKIIILVIISSERSGKVLDRLLNIKPIVLSKWLSQGNNIQINT